MILLHATAYHACSDWSTCPRKNKALVQSCGMAAVILCIKEILQAAIADNTLDVNKMNVVKLLSEQEVAKSVESIL